MEIREKFVLLSKSKLMHLHTIASCDLSAVNCGLNVAPLSSLFPSFFPLNLSLRLHSFFLFSILLILCFLPQYCLLLSLPFPFSIILLCLSTPTLHPPALSQCDLDCRLIDTHVLIKSALTSRRTSRLIGGATVGK